MEGVNHLQTTTINILVDYSIFWILPVYCTHLKHLQYSYPRVLICVTTSYAYYSRILLFDFGKRKGQRKGNDNTKKLGSMKKKKTPSRRRP